MNEYVIGVKEDCAMPHEEIYGRITRKGVCLSGDADVFRFARYEGSLSELEAKLEDLLEHIYVEDIPERKLIK